MVVYARVQTCLKRDSLWATNSDGSGLGTGAIFWSNLLGRGGGRGQGSRLFSSLIVNTSSIRSFRKSCEVVSYTGLATHCCVVFVYMYLYCGLPIQHRKLKKNSFIMLATINNHVLWWIEVQRCPWYINYTVYYFRRDYISCVEPPLHPWMYYDKCDIWIQNQAVVNCTIHCTVQGT